MRWLALALAASAFGGAAHADTPRVSYVVADPDLVDTSPRHTSNVIYLNGCFGNGDCTLTRGQDSSINNSSSIIPTGTWTIPPFPYGPVAWDAVVECVKQTYAPFNITITDVDPSPASHFEAIIAGEPNDVPNPQFSGSYGVSPFAPDCGVINNAITFTFAESIGNLVNTLCWTAAQESAHAFGLEHEYLCADPMTYLTSCGSMKRFQDVNADCGELSPNVCLCSGGKQNSFKKIRDHFGPSTPTPPSVTITQPANNAQVDPGFEVHVDATDDIQVVSVELYVNNLPAASSTSAPYVLAVPTTISNGVLDLRVVATDNFGFEGEASISVTQGQPCTSDDGCIGELETCVSGRCVPGPGAQDGLGRPCTDDTECASGLCAQGPNDEKRCVEVCTDSCPEGFGCISAGDVNVCWLGADDKGGCSAGGRGRGGSWPALIVLWLVFTRRGKRS